MATTVVSPVTPQVFSDKIADSPFARLIKRGGVVRQSGNLPQYMKSVTFQYFLEPFVSQVALVAKHHGRKTLVPEDVETACKMNGKELAMGLNITDPSKTKGLYGCKNRGKKSESNGTEENKGAKKKRRKRPGTASIQQIRRLQKDSDCLELPISNFTFIVKGIAAKQIDGVRFREGTAKLIQLVTEDWVYKLSLRSNCAASHRNAQTVNNNDVNLALLLSGEIDIEQWTDLNTEKERDALIDEVLGEGDESEYETESEYEEESDEE